MIPVAQKAESLQSEDLIDPGFEDSLEGVAASSILPGKCIPGTEEDLESYSPCTWTESDTTNTHRLVNEALFPWIIVNKGRIDKAPMV